MVDETVSLGRTAHPAYTLPNILVDQRLRLKLGTNASLNGASIAFSNDNTPLAAVELPGEAVLGPCHQQTSHKTGHLREVASLAVKRLIDVTGALTGLLLLSPLLLLIAATIKLTSNGPAIFRQERHGRNGTRFVIYKFRSMRWTESDERGTRQAVRDDPRITGIGHFLRRSNFDELPQLINVLKGEMSLVGPRPHVPGMIAAGVPYEAFDRRYMDRHRVKPGLTGLAQVNGFRGPTSTRYAARMRLEYDLIYIRNRSTALDLKILLETVIREFFKGNGY